MLNPDDYWAMTWVKMIVLSLLGGFAGVISYLLRQMDAGLPIKASRAAVEFFSSLLAAFFVFLTCKALGLDEVWTALACGLFGWLGAKATIMALEKLIEKKLGISTDLMAPADETQTLTQSETDGESNDSIK